MGEIAEQIQEGFLCESCACLVDGDCPGFPRKCEDCVECWEQHDREKAARARATEDDGGNDG